jgi:small-conductance mechanosensitive channel
MILEIMKQIRQILYVVFVVAIATVPAVASAQWDPHKLIGTGLPADSIYNIITRTMDWLLAILGFIGIIGFAIAGILYLTAAGNEAQAETAKKAMLYSILGIVVALIGFVIIRAVDGWLGGDTRF